MICDTRWWSKDVALSKIFGSFENQQGSLYIDVILSLQNISEEEKFSSDVRAKALSYKEALLKYETIMTASIYLRIFNITTPLSKYLQTVGIDLLKAHQLVMGTLDQLLDIQRNCEGVRINVDKFIDWATDELENKSPESDIVIQDFFPERRQRKRSKLRGEGTDKETTFDVYKDYEINVHNRILDNIIESIKARFEKREKKRDFI